LSITATTLDSKDVMNTKYEDAAHNVQELAKMGEECLNDVDVTKLSKHLPKGKVFDKIFFGFPHVGMGIKDQQRNIHANQKLLNSFFKSAQKFLSSDGDIHVLLKNGEPYESWDVKDMAKMAGMACIRSVAFDFTEFHFHFIISLPCFRGYRNRYNTKICQF
jgi:25S rRNA (uracil2634-N3)-methyltransferase